MGEASTTGMVKASERPTDVEINYRPLLNITSILRKCGIDPSPFFSDMPHTLEEYERKRLNMPWHLFVKIMARAEEALGGEAGYIETVEREAYHAEGNELMAAFGGYFAGPRQLYWVLIKWLGPWGFPFAKFTLEELADQRVKIVIQLPEHVDDSPSFFKTWLAGFIGTPYILGLPRSLVEVERTPRRWTYWITPPPSLTLWARIRRAGKAFVAAKSSIEELARQQEEIRRTFELRLEDQRKVMAAEVKLQISQQSSALSKLSALGEMAGGIAHEINNPLSIIATRGQALQRWLDKQPGEHEHVRDEVEKMVQTAMRISKITRGLLSFSREAASDPLERAPVASIVANTLSFCEKKFESAGIRIKDEIAPKDLQIRCRPTQISQVLLNLLNNSFDALENYDTGDGKLIVIGAKSENGMAVLTVTDNGRGISDDIKDKVFQPFFTTKAIGKGTGLGLSISRGIIEGNGGTLSFESKPGQTTFFVRLPRD